MITFPSTIIPVERTLDDCEAFGTPSSNPIKSTVKCSVVGQ